MQYLPVADVMPVNHSEKLRTSFHFMNNVNLYNIDGDKFFKVRPIIETIRNGYVKIEPKE